ncbi:tRNA (adenosine(37)-N6)-threonylcarbamoyltransferase complex dimerization subunit type 1 TsaB [Gordonia soli]|uniref:Gcp-like domain-containing protein n=1 Tax=Gordonia soli NBRC 108243 TaxID=1223545 RepID=M0QMW7_9ACTN|nr:tRNA (adenosine(37)-N6)-threonylcarbamoyltransferase complex dimerization subunit type 1 TsaB [Gordonia soli]GAC69898.1 hypothetical protein GS4_28_01470 [Gordonia soli NBRC 108243]
MRILALDTSTPSVIAGVAELDGVATGPDVLATRMITDARRHAEVLTTSIAEVLEESGTARADLGALVVGTGPGPFTGLRVGMATAAAFGDAVGIPVYGVCSLDAIAVDEFAHGGAPTVLVITDARRREVYWARYRDGRRLDGPGVLAPAELVSSLTDTDIDIVCGSPDHAALFGRPVGAATVPTVAGLIVASQRPLDGSASGLGSGAAPGPLTPLYLRRPDAVEQADRTSAGGPR